MQQELETVEPNPTSLQESNTSLPFYGFQKLLNPSSVTELLSLT